MVFRFPFLKIMQPVALFYNKHFLFQQLFYNTGKKYSDFDFINLSQLSNNNLTSLAKGGNTEGENGRILKQKTFEVPNFMAV